MVFTTRTSCIGVFMFFCLARGIYTQVYRNMSSVAGMYSASFVTVPNDTVAKKIARGLVENKLAACVNIIPQLTSVYEWEGKVQEEPELLLMIKTRTETVDALTEYVKRNHPYTICEVISLPIQNGNIDYLNWIGETVPPPLDQVIQKGQDTENN
ncbi:PREDICTED: protein CutA homolog [Dinoponera quadriceps]|uniref:Protein CutA homolog n=1 Tax=Dinoponera quadriceps TaxID=609295 RepID=A0A6P3XFY4_DINQU|nr:PREDICTED: protein CutA homolog [Dinoponera quadriceps]